LVCRVPGALAALLVDRDGVRLARSQGEVSVLEAGVDRFLKLLRRSLDAAERLDHGPAREVMLEAEQRTLALFPLRHGCCLLLLLRPAASSGHALFEARKAVTALNRVL
jgi:predicted regulator of Ras-like GTPase activity (Roadblock/LC7/MglB family)